MQEISDISMVLLKWMLLILLLLLLLPPPVVLSFSKTSPSS
jgi:hypothetical protein